MSSSDVRLRDGVGASAVSTLLCNDFQSVVAWRVLIVLERLLDVTIAVNSITGCAHRWHCWPFDQRRGSALTHAAGDYRSPVIIISAQRNCSRARW